MNSSEIHMGLRRAASNLKGRTGTLRGKDGREAKVHDVRFMIDVEAEISRIRSLRQQAPVQHNDPKVVPKDH
jgi:hypothetical protein